MAAPTAGSGRSQSTASQQPEVDTMIGPFKRLESIGKGSFAMVYRGVHVKRRSLVAIKSVQLYKLNKKLKDNLLSEIKILRSLHHPHIVALIDCQESSAYMHIVMEFCELGDLSTFIKKRSSLADHPATAAMMKKYPNPPYGGLNEVIVRHFLKQIASALEFLRAKTYVHRDLKPQNLLLNPSPLFYAKHKPETMPLAADDKSLVPAAGVASLPVLKVADFGFARVLPTTSLAETLCGSPLYMAPEILRYEKYDATADLWSVGTVLHEMCVGKPPFRANNHVELLRKIETQNDSLAFSSQLAVSRDMKRLIRSLLKKTSTERMDYEAFFDDVVVTGEIPGLVGEDVPRAQRPEPEPEPVPSGSELRAEPGSPVSEPRSPSVQNSRPAKDKAPLGSSPASRPPSRATAAPTAGTPPNAAARPRRPSGTLTSGNDQLPAQKERRPALASHVTAPARQGAVERSPTSAAAAVLGRRNSRASASPSSSLLREHYDRERIPQRADDRALREAKERIAQDVAFERDYVVVEKRAVEVNAFADELAASPQLRAGFRDRPSSPQGAMVRRATTHSPSAGSAGQPTSARAIQTANGRQRTEPLHQRTGSYERRYGPNPTSATSAISKALNMANFRLFGVGASPPLGKGPSPPRGYGAFPTYPTAQSSLVVVGDVGRAPNSKDEDTRIIVKVEDLAHTSHVVFGFAEVKYKQLLPAPPSTEPGFGIGQTTPDDGPGDDDDVETDDLTTEAVVTIAEEALVLYVKALSVLAKAIDIAGSWWGRKNRHELGGDPLQPRSGSPSSNLAPVGSRMNQVVQWIRTRFNECMDKAEFVKRKLLEAQKLLPANHPFHPSNHPPASTSATSIGGSSDDFRLTTGITAEKLMYERAMEMSRAAAVSELVGEDLEGCELNYGTAIRMLEAILEIGEEPSGRKASSGKSASRDDDMVDGLTVEDRQTVRSLIESMKTRLNLVAKKTEVQKAAKRASLPPPPARPSPSSSPITTTPPR